VDGAARENRLDLHVSLDGRRGVTVQVYRQIRDAVMDGRLRAGDVLPSSRELARGLQLSRNTVVLAYDRLRAEGFLQTRMGAGTFVGPISAMANRVRPNGASVRIGWSRKGRGCSLHQ
jgi:GntR family transcriptional regulator/MocR family aminotransferase